MWEILNGTGEYAEYCNEGILLQSMGWPSWCICVGCIFEISTLKNNLTIKYQL